MQTSTAILTTDYRDPSSLKPHPDNPRGEIDPDSPEVVSLAESLTEKGMLQPILITPEGRILAGHRRRIAALRAGLPVVPVVIRELRPSEFAEEIFLAENMQRQDLSPLEEARAIDAVKRKLEKQTKRKVANTDLARRLEIPKHVITPRLNILRLPKRVQNLFHLYEIAVNSSTQLCRLEEWPEEIEKIADRMVTRQVSYASLDAIVTRKLHQLRDLKDNQAILDREPKMRAIKSHYPENHHTPALTREVAVENVNKKLTGTVSMFTVKTLLDSVCCSCGMVGNNAVCLSCPLPKFVNGLAGRADMGDTRSDDDE